MWASISFFYLLFAQAEPVKISTVQIPTAVEVAKSKETVVYRDNVGQFKDRLLAPIVSWVESDLFRFKIQDREIKEIQVDPTLDKIILSQNIARNVIYDAEFAWLTVEKLLRRAKTIFYRKYSVFPPNKEQDVLYEEVFRFIEPAVLNSYATQTFRFNTDEGDQISHYSPVVGAVRPIQAANRSDSIIDGEITLDDIFVFSADIRSFSVKFIEQKIMFVPFAAEQALEKSPPLYSYKNNTIERFDLSSPLSYSTLVGKQSSLEQRSLVLWNYEVKAFSSHAAWLPLTITFEPRQVLIYELYPKDPFYSVGKQYLIVDAINGLPYYKLVYSYSGKFVKTVLGGWQKVVAPKELAQEFACAADCFVPVFVLAVDRAARNASVLSVHNAQFYTNQTPDLNFVFTDQPKQEVVLSQEVSSDGSAGLEKQEGATAKNPVLEAPPVD